MLPYIHWLYDDLYVVDQEIEELKSIPKCITWNVNKKIKSKRNIYLQILSQEDNVKDFHKDNEFYQLFETNLNILKETGIPFTRKNFFRSINESIIIDYFNQFNDYAKQWISSFESPLDSDNLVEIFQLINYFEKKPLNLRGQLKSYNPYLGFSPFTKTQRLRTITGFFPIYNLEKSLRIDIIPWNDYILSIDYNAAEFRIFLSLLGLEQPTDDAYLEVQKMFNLDSRSEAKQKVFEIVYSNHYNNSKITSILSKYVEGNYLTTPYGSKIYLDEKSKTINYLCQSTCSSLIFEKTLELIKLLESMSSKSRILFDFHDEIVFDLHKDDICNIRKFKEIISNTRFGYFNNRVKIGTNYFNLKEVDV